MAINYIRSARPSAKKATRVRKRASTVAGCRALVPGDGLSLRKKLMKELKSAERRFGNAQRQWMNHQQVDMPAYWRWHHLELGPLEQERNRYQGELHLYVNFLEGLEQERFAQGRSIPALLGELVAYAEVHDDGNGNNRLDGEWSPAYLMSCGYTLWQEPRMREFDRKQEQFRQEQRQRQDKAGKKRGAHLDGSIMDFLLGMLEEEFGPEAFGGEFSSDPDFKTPFSAPKGETREQDFRTLYRKLCRALHPDVAGEVTPERQRLWLEVQDAYEARDFERLEALHAAWEMKSDPQGKLSTCARILAATRECLMGLRSLQGDLRKAKKQPGWQFAVLTGNARAKRAEQIRAQLKQDVGDLKWSVDRERREFQRVMKKARPPHKKSRAGSSPAADGLFGPALF